LNAFAVALHDGDGGTDQTAKHTLDSFRLELDIFLAYVPVPAINHYVVSCEAFNIGAKVFSDKALDITLQHLANLNYYNYFDHIFCPNN
jgi:hypothetical protein